MLTVRSLIPTLDRAFSLDRDLDRFMGSSWTNGVAWLPPTDLVEKDEAYVVTMELPGVKPESVELSFEKDTLTVKGTKLPAVTEKENEEIRVFAAERVTGSFERSIRFPTHVDAEKILAKYEHGVLQVTVPKVAAVMPRKITIAMPEVAPAAPAPSKN
jgi:HSP20 family protein